MFAAEGVGLESNSPRSRVLSSSAWHREGGLFFLVRHVLLLSQHFFPVHLALPASALAIVLAFPRSAFGIIEVVMGCAKFHAGANVIIQAKSSPQPVDIPLAAGPLLIPPLFGL